MILSLQSTQLLPPIKKTLKKATGPLDIYSTEVVVDGNRVKAGLTLRQTVPYDAQRRAEVLEEKVHRSEVGLHEGLSVLRNRAKFEFKF